MSARNLFTTVAVAVFVGACGDAPSSAEPAPAVADARASTPPATTLAERACPPESELDYESFGAPFMLTWCVGCHSASLAEGGRRKAPVGLDFNTIADVRRHKERIWARAADGNTTMPPSGGPAAEERARLGEWLACGAK